MATEAEVERMVVRLIGDNKSYTAMLQQAERSTEEMARRVQVLENELRQVSGGLDNAGESSRRAGSNIDRLAKRMRELGSSVSSVGSRLMSLGSRLTLFVTGPIVAAGLGFIKLASDAAETASKFEVVFSGVIDGANRMAKNLQDKYGMGITESKRLLSSTGDLLAGFGFTQKEALDLSSQVQTLSSDLSSFQNIPVAEASEAITKGLLGERESMKRLSIAINENTDQWKDMLKEVEETTGAVGIQAKALATLRIAQLQSKNSIGDLARTWDQFANQLRFTIANLTNVAEAFGADLLPMAAKALQHFRRLVIWMQNLSSESRKVIIVVTALVGIIGPLVTVVGLLTVALGAVISAVGTIAGVISTVGLPVILAIAAAVVAATVAVTAFAAAFVSLVGMNRIVSFFTDAAQAVGSFVEQAIGFFSDFQTNIGRLGRWFQRNWENILSDIHQLFVQTLASVVHNVGVVLKTMGRLFTAFGGWLAANVFRLVFRGELVRWVVAGLQKAAELFFRFAINAWEALKSIFTGKKISMSDLLEQMGDDFKGGVTDFSGTAKNIIEEGLGEIRFPTDQFKRSTEDLPNFAADQGRKIGEEMAEGIQKGLKGGLAGIDSAFLDVAASASKFTMGLVDQAASMNTWAGAAKDFTLKLKDQVETFGMSSREAELWRLQQSGMPEIFLSMARALDRQLTALEKDNALMEKGTRVTQEFLSPAEKYIMRMQELNELKEAGKITDQTFQRASEAAREELEKMQKSVKELNEEFKDLTAIRAGSREFRELQHNTQQLLSKIQPQINAMADAAPAPAPVQPRGGGDIITVKLTNPIAQRDNTVMSRVASGVERLVSIANEQLNKPPIETEQASL